MFRQWSGTAESSPDEASDGPQHHAAMFLDDESIPVCLTVLLDNMYFD